MKFNKAFFFLPFIFDYALAGSCCGNASSLSGVIVGDVSNQFTVSYQHRSTIAEANSESNYTLRNKDHTEASKISRIEGTLLLNDFWQAGAGFSHISKDKDYFGKTTSAEGLAEAWGFGAYEFLPELTYSEWKPRGFLIFKLLIPAGPSIYDFESPMGADIRSSGFYTPSLALLLSKQKHLWDFSFAAEVHKPIRREFHTTSGNRDIDPDPGGFLSLGCGYNWKSGTRLGANFGPYYEGAKKIQNATLNDSKDKLYWNLSASISQVLTTEFLATISYLDQTLIGPARNATLDRAASFQLIYQHPR